MSLKNTLDRLSSILAAVALCAAVSGCGGGGGGGGGGAAPPPQTPASFISVSKPSNGSAMSDVAFRATDTFYIEISHTAPLETNSLSVTFRMDSGSAQNITGYFTEVNSTTLRSGGMTAFTRGLFDFRTNDVNRVMTVTATARNSSGVSGSAATSFTVYPEVPGGGVGARPSAGRAGQSPVSPH